MESIHAKAVQYPWDQHLKPKGSNPGEIVEEDGVRKMRTQDGGLEPIGYTADYINNNAVPIGDTGQIFIPVAPDQPGKIVEARQRDLGAEQGQIDHAAKGINQIYDKLAEAELARPERQVDLGDGKTEPVPLNAEESRALSIAAADAYMRQQMQAKNVAQTVADAGASQLRRAIAKSGRK